MYRCWINIYSKCGVNGPNYFIKLKKMSDLFIRDNPVSLLDQNFCHAASLITSVAQSTVSSPNDTSECKIIDTQEKFHDGKSINQLSIKELKELCTLKGLKTSGRKSDLELRLSQVDLSAFKGLKPNGRKID